MINSFIHQVPLSQFVDQNDPQNQMFKIYKKLLCLKYIKNNLLVEPMFTHPQKMFFKQLEVPVNRCHVLYIRILTYALKVGGEGNFPTKSIIFNHVTKKP